MASAERVGTGRRANRAGIVIAALLLGASALVFYDMRTLTLSATYGIGPQAMSAVVAGGLGLLGLGNLALAFRGEPPAPETGDGRAILLILAGLAVLIASIALGGGFIVGTAFLFALTARAFGRQAFLADLLIGLGLGLLTYLLLAKLLTLSLPTGPLERLI